MSTCGDRVDLDSARATLAGEGLQRSRTLLWIHNPHEARSLREEVRFARRRKSSRTGIARETPALPEHEHNHLRNGRIIDPANKRDEVADLAIVDGKIAQKSEVRGQKSDEIDAKGLIVAPGLIDIHVHLREPGFSS